MWQCAQCGLLNYPTQLLCIACFTEKPISIISPIITPIRPNIILPLSIAQDTFEFSASDTWFNIEFKQPQIDNDTIKPIQTKQKLLFYGFIRIKITQIILDYIPNDIVNLIFEFFKVNINQLCVEIKHSNTFTEISDKYLTMKTLYKSASMLRKQHNFFIANEILSILTQLNHEKAKYFNEKGLVLKLWGELTSSEICYKRAIELKSTSCTQRWNYGLLLEEQERYAEALEQFQCARRLDIHKKKHCEYIFEIAYCYQKLKDFDNATINYLKAIELEDGKAKYYIYYADYLCCDLNNFEASKEWFEKLIKIEPNNANCYYQYARVYRDYGNDYNKAEFYYKKCLQIDDRIRGLNGSYGYLLYLKQRYNEAGKHLKIAIVNDYNTVWSHYYYALLQTHIGNHIEADIALNKAVNRSFKISSILSHLRTIKKADSQKMEFHNKFERLLKERQIHLQKS
eukprot:323665_1